MTDVTPLPRAPVTFACPRCNSLLEAPADHAGRVAQCPTCGARLVVPARDPDSPGLGSPGAARARTLDGDDEPLPPMHAYAADGSHAPQIIVADSGQQGIRCPSCGRVNDIAVHGCGGCGTPFTIEGAARAGPPPGQVLGRTALIVGLVSLPAAPLVVPALMAVVFGILSITRQRGRLPNGCAIAGIVLGVVSLLVYMFMPR
jgi:DNA-directed RNA polymerase subunit RPC12/RpoP